MKIDHITMNSFQKWAMRELSAAGFSADRTGNWISVNGEALMTYAGVRDFIAGDH